MNRRGILSKIGAAVAGALGLSFLPQKVEAKEKKEHWWRIIDEYKIDGVKVVVYEWPNDRPIVFSNNKDNGRGYAEKIWVPAFDIRKTNRSFDRQHIADAILFTEKYEHKKPVMACVVKIKENYNFIGILCCHEEMFPCENFSIEFQG